MESVASNSPPMSDRILLCLLHRLDSNFFILGATGNVYTVNLSATPSCTCPHPTTTTPCNHILFVFIGVLGVSLDDVCLRRKTLRPCQLHRLLNTPTLPEAIAGARLRQRFHQLYSNGRRMEIEDGTRCPVCLEEMGKDKEERLVACGRCENPIHEECLVRWKRSTGKRWARCVICRAKWRDQDKYLNLSAYVIEDDTGQPSGTQSLYTA